MTSQMTSCRHRHHAERVSAAAHAVPGEAKSPSAAAAAGEPTSIYAGDAGDITLSRQVSTGWSDVTVIYGHDTMFML